MPEGLGWDVLRQTFVQGDMTLIELSRERTGLDASPKYKSLRNRASSEQWTERRRSYREQKVLSLADPTEADPSEVSEALGAIVRHTRMAQSLQTMVGEFASKLAPAIANLKDQDFAALTPRQTTELLKNLAAVAATAATIERQALGLPTADTPANPVFVVALPEQCETLEEWSALAKRSQENQQN